MEHWEDSCNLKEFSIFPIFALLRKKSQEKEAGRNMGTRLYLQWINCSMHSAARLHCSDYLSFLTKTSLNKVHLSPHPSADPPLISPSMSPSVSSSEVWGLSFASHPLNPCCLKLPFLIYFFSYCLNITFICAGSCPTACKHALAYTPSK